jgi:uncharacterized membrane protein
VIVLPGVITLAVVKWFFGTVSSFTDTLLFFLPYFLDPKLIYENGSPARCSGIGACWRCCWRLHRVRRRRAGAVLHRQAADCVGGQLMLRVPVLNKIYGTIKQVDEAFTSGKKSSFKTVVLVEYPREGIYSVGFITSEQADPRCQKTNEKMRLRFHPDDADSHRRFSDPRAGGKSHQARHERGRRFQIHHQPRRPSQEYARHESSSSSNRNRK